MNNNNRNYYAVILCQTSRQFLTWLITYLRGIMVVIHTKSIIYYCTTIYYYVCIMYYFTLCQHFFKASEQRNYSNSWSDFSSSVFFLLLISYGSQLTFRKTKGRSGWPTMKLQVQTTEQSNEAIANSRNTKPLLSSFMSFQITCWRWVDKDKNMNREMLGWSKSTITCSMYVTH
jgi:hypothetical protein